MVRRIVWVALAAAACSEVSSIESGSTATFYKPIGLAVRAGKLVVASSNGDLRFDTATGGSVVSVDPTADRGSGLAGLVGGFDIQSFAGEMAMADRDACPDLSSVYPQAVAVVPVRGTNLLYLVGVDAAGAVSCPGCEVPIGGTDHVDPYFAGIACGNGIARAYVSFLRSATGAAWISQIDLAKAANEDGFVQSAPFGIGNTRGFAYDADLRRMYVAVSGNGASSEVRWLDLAGDCRIDIDPLTVGGCATGSAPLPTGLEATGIALSTPDPAFALLPRRVYVSARVTDGPAGGGFNVAGVLVVADLVGDATGGQRLAIVDQVPIGAGPAKVVALPKPASRAGKRDVVAVLVSDDGLLWIYDDETGDRLSIGRDANGHPKLGASPADVAADPSPQGNLVHLYVSSYGESFVNQIDVPVDDISTLREPDGGFRRIFGGAP